MFQLDSAHNLVERLPQRPRNLIRRERLSQELQPLLEHAMLLDPIVGVARACTRRQAVATRNTQRSFGCCAIPS